LSALVGILAVTMSAAADPTIGFRVRAVDLIPDNFGSIERLRAYVQRSQGAKP
jgi:hypothetical protein